MNDELQKKLIQWAEKIGDIASEQLPDFAMQIVAYKIWVSYIWMTIGFSLAAVLGFIVVILILFLCFSDAKERDDLCGCIAIFLFAACFPLAVGGYNYTQVIKCEVAPKLVIIDYIRGG